MIDADAFAGRRAWAGCPRCRDGAGCRPCRAGRSCERHWRYLLGVDGCWVFLQCPGCHHRWWHDTDFGAGARPDRADELLGWPQPRQPRQPRRAA